MRRLLLVLMVAGCAGSGTGSEVGADPGISTAGAGAMPRVGPTGAAGVAGQGFDGGTMGKPMPIDAQNSSVDAVNYRDTVQELPPDARPPEPVAALAIEPNPIDFGTTGVKPIEFVVRNVGNVRFAKVPSVYLRPGSGGGPGGTLDGPFEFLGCSGAPPPVAPGAVACSGTINLRAAYHDPQSRITYASTLVASGTPEGARPVEVTAKVTVAK